MLHRLHEAIKSSKSVDFIYVSDPSLFQRAPEDLYGFIVGLERNWEGVVRLFLREQRNGGQDPRIVSVRHESPQRAVPAIAAFEGQPLTACYWETRLQRSAESCSS